MNPLKLQGIKTSTSYNVVFAPILCLSNSVLFKISNILNGHIELSIYNIIGIFVQIFHSIFKMNEWTAVSLAVNNTQAQSKANDKLNYI